MTGTIPTDQGLAARLQATVTETGRDQPLRVSDALTPRPWKESGKKSVKKSVIARAIRLNEEDDLFDNVPV